MKRKAKQSKVSNCNKVRDCKNEVSNKTNKLGFEKETKSFKLDENDSNSFELK